VAVLPLLAEGIEQRPEFENLSEQHGLLDARVWDVVEDSQGFLWVATANGLYRYDGYAFKPFLSDPTDPESLSDSRLRCLLVDREGVLWVGTASLGLNRYDASTERFTRFVHNPGDPLSLSDDQIRSIDEDRKGNLWIGTINGLNRMDRQTGRFIRYRHDPNDPKSLGHDRVDHVLEDGSGNVWVATYGGGLNKFVPGDDTFIHYRLDPRDPLSSDDNRIYRLAEDASGMLWVGTWGGGLAAFDRETERFTRYTHDPENPTSLPGMYVSNVFEDRAGVLWVTTMNGVLSTLDRERHVFVRYLHDPYDARSPSRSLHGPMYEDARGSLWLGTFGDGLDVWHRSKRQFTHYTHNPVNPNSLAANVVFGMHGDGRGRVWIATFDGLSEFDPDTETFTTYRHDPTDPHSLSAKELYSVYEDKAGSIWVGTHGGGVNRLDRRTGRFTHYRHDPADPTSLSDDEVISFLEDRKGTLWVGTYTGGVNHFDRRTRRFTRFLSDPNDSSSLSAGTITQMLEDRRGDIWIGTAGGGLKRWVPESSDFVRYQHDPTDPNSLAHNEVWVMHLDRKGELWIGTGAGLQRLESSGARGSERFVLYADDDGLPPLALKGILEDEEGNFWLSTSGQGLWKFNPETGAARQFDESDGIQRSAFSFASAWRMKDGRMLFGGTNGFNLFHPADVRTNTHVPPIVITGFELENRRVALGPGSVLQKSIVATRELTLSHRDRVVSFEFAALDFQAPERNRYRYKLEGFDEEWTETDSMRRRATYTNLAPGEYLFRVKGSNNHGVWNEEGASIQLTVTPPWWQTWSFRTVALSGLVGGLVFVHRLRMKYFVERTEALAKEVVERQEVETALRASHEETRHLATMLMSSQEEESKRIARELHDDTTQRLAALGIDTEQAIQKLDASPARARREFRDVQEKLSLITSDVHKLSRRLHPSMLDDVGLINAVRSECHEFSKRYDTQVDFVTRGEPDAIPKDIALTLYRIVQEALNNTAKHARAERRRVELAAVNGSASVVVEDDGAGFDAGRRHRGLGLSSLEERVKLYGGELEVRSSPGAGTRITAHIPFAGVAE